MVDWKLSLKEAAKALGLTKKSHRQHKTKLHKPAKAIQSTAIEVKPVRLTGTLSVCCKHTQRKPHKSARRLASRSVGSQSKILVAHFENEAHPTNKSIYKRKVDFALWQATRPSERPFAGKDAEPPACSVHALGQRWNRFDLHGFHY